MSKEREEHEAQKAQWAKEAKELEQHIYDNFYEDKDNLSKYDYIVYALGLQKRNKEEFATMLRECFDVEKVVDAVDGDYNGFDDLCSSLVEKALIEAAKEDLDNRLNLIDPSDYQESKEDIINNIADNQRGLNIEMGE